MVIIILTTKVTITMPNWQLIHKILVILLFQLLIIVQPLCLTQQTDTTTNYATNGDFQNPYLGPNSWRFETTQLYGWSSTKIEHGTGSIYNPAWGSATQVIQMDTDINQMYNQTLNLPKSKFSIKVSYAARSGAPLTTSGLRIWWNGQVIRNIPTSLDYNIHTETFIVQANAGNNYLILEGAGTSDGVGMTCDNIIFNKIQSYNRVQVNGQCICDIGYFDDFMNWSCQPCTSLDTKCLKCSYVPITNSSSHQFTCQTCSEGYFSQGGACASCSVAYSGCYNCSMDGLDCYDCNQTENYFQAVVYGNYTGSNYTGGNYSGGNLGCVLCTLEGCITCSSLQSCLTCNNTANYFPNLTTTLCQQCTLTGCLTCTSLTTCILCDNITYYFQNASATQCTFCDPALNMFINGSQLCEQCAILGCRVCGGLDFCDVCVQGLYLLDERGLCQLCVLEGCTYCQSKTKCLTCDAENYYNLDENTGQCIKCLSCICHTGKIQAAGVPEIVYSEQQCQAHQKIQELSIFIGVASYIIMFFAIMSVKIVGLELFGVLQLAFFNLADNSQINLYLSPLLSWKYLNGFNLDLSTAQPSIPQNVQAIKYNGSFISNINIMFLLLLIQFCVASLLILLARKLPILTKISKFMFHEVFLTLFLFSSFNIAFSVGLHFKYATSENTDNYILSTFAAVLGVLFYLIILVVIQTANQDQFGQFKNKFKRDFVNQGYIFVSVLYRMALGVYMAVGNQQTYSTLLILSISFTYIMYNITNLPFTNAYQNYRANLCHITQLLILLVTNYYRSMQYNQKMEIKAKIYTPAKIELIMIVICVVVSGVCLGYEIYLLVREKLGLRKVGVGVKGESFHNITLESQAGAV